MSIVPVRSRVVRFGMPRRGELSCGDGHQDARNRDRKWCRQIAWRGRATRERAHPLDDAQERAQFNRLARL